MDFRSRLNLVFGTLSGCGPTFQLGGFCGSGGRSQLGGFAGSGGHSQFSPSAFFALGAHQIVKPIYESMSTPMVPTSKDFKKTRIREGDHVEDVNVVTGANCN